MILPVFVARFFENNRDWFVEQQQTEQKRRVQFYFNSDREGVYETVSNTKSDELIAFAVINVQTLDAKPSIFIKHKNIILFA